VAERPKLSQAGQSSVAQDERFRDTASATGFGCSDLLGMTATIFQSDSGKPAEPGA